MKNHLKLLVSFLLLWVGISSWGYNSRQINANDGLTNTAVLSLCPDENGLLWIGTCDGLNIYDGFNLFLPRELPEYSQMTGNIIERIIQAAPGSYWVQTNYGLNKVVPTNGYCKLFPQFQGKEKLAMSQNGVLLVLSENGTLYYFIEGRSTAFERMGKINIPFDDVCEIVYNGSFLRVFTRRGVWDYDTNRVDDKLSLGSAHLRSDVNLLYAFNDGDVTLAIDHEGDILEFRANAVVPARLHNIMGELNARGVVSDMLLSDGGDIFVSFLTTGLIRLGVNGDKGMVVEDMGLNVGVFCLSQSPTQGVVWAGTDCHGVYAFFEGDYSVESLKFSAFNNLISRPVRALLVDEYKNLWIGTKGDGVLMVPGFNEANGRVHGRETLFTTENSELGHNSVFAFSRSSRPVMWIATDNGLNYYSYVDRRIHRVATPGVPIANVHSVYEPNDSTLVLATTGHGVFVMKIGGTKASPTVHDIKRYTVDNGNFSSNFFFSVSNDSVDAPVFANRGLGAFVLEGDSLKSVMNLVNEYDNRTIFDVFAVVREKKNGVLWLGTGHGLLKLQRDGDKLFAGAESGFVNNTIHSMLRDEDGNLWISTNQGLVCFNTETEKVQVYNANYGLRVNEFSDGAAFKTAESMLFGGVDGIVIVSKNRFGKAVSGYRPRLLPVGLTVSGETVLMSHYFHVDSDGKMSIKLAHNENYFSITFSAPDYINTANYDFLYSLDGKTWINNGNNRTITFTRMNYGDNKLLVKYINRQSGVESNVVSIDLSIQPPWYLSTIAKWLYFLLLCGVAYAIIRTYLARQRFKQGQILERMEQAHKEEVYEGKLRFFTNITHEFCTPLTLIFGSCERILAYKDADDHMQKYVSLIRSNTERLNSLIQDLIDFRRIETGNKDRKISRISVSEVCGDIYESFTVIAEQNGIRFEGDIAPGIYFNSDYKALLRIMSNLLSNAFKYTHSGGVVRFGVKMQGDNLSIEVYNTGKGISEKEKQRVFNRYSILDNVEENATRGLSSRNGLGMAICSSLVEMLDGKIDIQSEVGQYALFTVTLPPLECNVQEEIAPSKGVTPMMQPVAVDTATEPDVVSEHRIGCESILVIDDNRDILTLLADSLSEYNVHVAANASEGLEVLKHNNIDLIITDVMMPGIDGVALTKIIKGNKHTMHIPLIILSAKNTNAEKVEGLASGADAYVGKPFQLSYLRAVIVRLLENRRVMKEYYNTSASAYEYSGGQLVDRESKAFIDKIVEFIDNNIDDHELSTEQLANHMQVSVRNLYRKFKDLGLASPNDFIKSHRIAFAAKLLLTTSLTVQEIIYRSGFNNRSHFYREFDKQHGMTPKDYRTSNKTSTTL